MADLNQQDSNLASNGAGADPLRKRLEELKSALEKGDLYFTGEGDEENGDKGDLFSFDVYGDSEGEEGGEDTDWMEREDQEALELLREEEEEGEGDFSGIKGIGTRVRKHGGPREVTNRSVGGREPMARDWWENYGWSYYQPSRQDILNAGRRKAGNLKRSFQEAKKIEPPFWDKADFYDIEKTLHGVEEGLSRINDMIERMKRSLSEIAEVQKFLRMSLNKLEEKLREAGILDQE